MVASLVQTMLELSPWFLLGMAVAGLLHGLLPRNFIKRQLRGRFAVMKAVALGVPLPLCSCGVIPAGLGLKRDGASNGASLGFLISTPQTGVDSILVSATFLGWPFALFKVFAAAVTGLIGGVIADRLPDEDAVERDLASATPSDEAEEAQERGVRAMFEHAHDLLASIWRWLVFGVVVSALINTFLPVGTLEVFAEAGPLWAGFMVLLVSLPLYVCATASVPIAAALVANGMPVGAALVFLMAGPATNVATIGAIYRGFGGRQHFFYLLVLVLGSLGFGLLFDLGISPHTVASPHPESHATWWSVASAVILTGLIARLGFLDLWGKLRARFDRPNPTSMEVRVEGLSCGACERKVERALLGVDGVASVVVTRSPDRAVIVGNASLEEVVRAIGAAGYTAVHS